MFHQDLTGLGRHRGSWGCSGHWSSAHTHNAAWCGENEGRWAQPPGPQSEGHEGHTTHGQIRFIPIPDKFWMIL